jgi:hypothetical protein
MRIKQLVAWSWLALAACGSKAEVPAVHDQPLEPVAKVPDHCLAVGGSLDPARAVQQIGCPCDPKLQRNSCIEGQALVCVKDTWSRVEDGPCMPGPTSPATCTAPSPPGAPISPGCACGHDSCVVHAGAAHVCTGGQWRQVAVEDCWLRSKAR